MGVFANKAQQNNAPSATPTTTGGGMFARIAAEQQPKQPTFGGNIVRGIVKTPARLATNVVNAAQVATGNSPTQPFSGSYLGEVKPIGTEGTFGQKVKESVGAGLELASYLPVGRAVSAGVNIAKEPFKQTVFQGVKTLGKEGVVQGALGGAGRSMVDNKGFGETAINTALGGAVGGVLGSALGGATAGISRALTKKPIEAVKNEIVDATAKALGTSGKRPATQAVTQPIQQARGLATIRKYADNFDPKVSEDIFDDTLKGLISAKNKVFKSYDEIANQAGKHGITIDLDPLESALSKYTKGITTAPKRLRAERLLAELRSNFPTRKATPSQMQEYIQLLNEELGGVSGGAERGAVGVVADFTKQAREAMDTQIARLGGEYQVFRDDYASLKSIEDALVRQYQKAIRKKGGGLSEYADLIGNAEMLSGLISGNPALMAKSGVLKLGAKYISALNDPETYLRKAFQGLDEAGDVFTPAPKARTPQLMLPAPKEGLPKVQVKTPMNLGARSQSTIDAQEIARIQSQRSSSTAQTNLATKIPSVTAISVAKNPISKTLPRPKAKSIGTVDKLSKSIPKELETLAQEAKKYKSAEEFVKAVQTKDSQFYSEQIQRLKNKPKEFGIDNKPIIDLYKEKLADATNKELQKIKDITYSPVLSETQVNSIKNAESFDELWDVIKNEKADFKGMWQARMQNIFPKDTVHLTKSQLTDFYNKVKGNKGMSTIGAILGGAGVTGAGLASQTPNKTTYKAPQTKIITPKKLSDTLMQLESSGGKDKSSADKGELKWLTGLTNIAIKELKRTGIKETININDKKDVLDASIKYFNLLQKRYPKLSPAEVYVDHYWTQANSPEQRQKKINEFNNLINA